jgi:hypothetical protein
MAAVRIVWSVVTAAGAVLMLAGAVMLATRPTIQIPRGHDVYIGFADSAAPDLTVPIALALVALGFLAIAAAVVGGIVRDRS